MTLEKGTQKLAKTQAAKDGSYTFQNVQPGKYTVGISGSFSAKEPCGVRGPNGQVGTLESFIQSKPVEVTTKSVKLDLEVKCEPVSN